MHKVVLLNTTAINISQLSHLNINLRVSHGEIGIYANLINGQKLFLQKTESFEESVSKLKEFTQKCNGNYRPPLPIPKKSE